MKLSSTTENLFILFCGLVGVAYILFRRPGFGFSDIMLLILWGCVVVWLWRLPSSSQPSHRYTVEVCKPDNNPIHLIERK